MFHGLKLIAGTIPTISLQGRITVDYEKPTVLESLTETEVFGSEELMTSAWSNAWSDSWCDTGFVKVAGLAVPGC
jgi:hypothetical protein